VYADDTQLFLPFSAADFAYNISLRELTISNVYNWMSSNFLSVNPSETEFRLVGLPVHSACDLGVIFDSNLAFSEHVSTVSKSCFYHSHDLRHICNTVDHITTCNIATSLIHSKLY
jgi:hypothetical protein